MFQLAPMPEPRWIDVGLGLQFEVRSGPTECLAAARRYVRLLVEDDPTADSAIAFGLGCALWSVIGWRGIGAEGGGEAQLTPDNLVSLFRQRPDVFDSFDDQVVSPLLELLAEKNGSRPSPNGTSTAGQPTAGPAPKPARPARTGKTSRARNTAAASGTA